MYTEPSTYCILKWCWCVVLVAHMQRKNGAGPSISSCIMVVCAPLFPGRVFYEVSFIYEKTTHTPGSGVFSELL